MVAAVYELGSIVRIGPETFSDFNNQVVDPTTVSLSIKKPDGTIDGPFTYAAAQVVKDSVGVYHYDYTPATAGHYLYRWSSTGTGTAAAVGNFDIQDSFAPTIPIVGALQRIQQGAPATLHVLLTDQDGNPRAASGALTVQVTKADGTVVLAAGTATTAGTTGNYSVALTAAQTATLELLTATWTEAMSGTVTTSKHAIVGGFYFNLADVRQSNDGLLADPVKYPDALVLATRQEVEVEAEEICDMAFVRRYARETLSGDASPDLALKHNKVRTIRSVRIYPYAGATTYTLLSASQLAGLVIDDDGTVHRTDFSVWDQGVGNIVVEYEYGLDQPAADLRRAALTRLRSRLNFEKSGVNERATTFTAENGQSYNLSTAGTYSTGIPEVDAVYSRYSLRQLNGKDSRPVSRPMQLDPQRYSIWHGGIR